MGQVKATRQVDELFLGPQTSDQAPLSQGWGKTQKNKHCKLQVKEM